MEINCERCGRDGELGGNLIIVTGHESGSQRPINHTLCSDHESCNARLRKEIEIKKILEHAADEHMAAAIEARE